MKWESKPIRLSPQVWFYRNEKSIDLIVEMRDRNNVYIRTDQYRVPLKKLLGPESAGKSVSEREGR